MKRDADVSITFGPIGLLGILFVVLKLVGVISWSWWWVLAPFWISPVLILVALGYLITDHLLTSILDYGKRKLRG